MEDISDTTHDEYGQRTNGVLSSLDKFDSVFGLKLGYLLFGAAEQLSRTLLGKDTTLQESITTANLAKNHTTSHRGRVRQILPVVSPFQRVSLASRYCHDTEELPPDLTLELLLIALNVQRITIDCNTMKLATKLKRN